MYKYPLLSFFMILWNRPVLRSVVIGYLVLTLVCTAAIAYGDVANPRADVHAEDYAMCAEAMCFMGQIPGRSSWEEAHTRFQEQAESADYIHIRLKPDSGIAPTFVRSFNQETVGNIDVHFAEDTAFHVGWLVEQFGTPCGVSWYPGLPTIRIHYPFLSAKLLLEEDRFTPYTELVSLEIHDPAFVNDDINRNVCMDNNRNALNSDWQGFGTRTKYHPQ